MTEPFTKEKTKLHLSIIICSIAIGILINNFEDSGLGFFIISIHLGVTAIFSIVLYWFLRKAINPLLACMIMSIWNLSTGLYYFLN